MAFGQTVVLDDFNRADGDGLGSNWTEPMRSGDSSSDLDIASNQAASGIAGASSGYWNPSTFGPNLEGYLTVSIKPSVNSIVGVYGRIHEFVTAYPDGYAVHMITQTGTDLVRIFRSDDNVRTQLGADLSQEFTNGDGLGIECIGDQIAAYYRTGGAWSQLGVRTDATYNTAGNIGIVIQSTTTRVDDFGGGSISKAILFDAQRRNLLGVLPR